MRMSSVTEPGYDIPIGYSTDYFKPTEIRHFTLRMSAVANELHYDLYGEIEPIPATLDHKTFVECYARVRPPVPIPKPEIESALVFRAATPWDLPVDGVQCYVVLDLDPDWKNWRFVGRGLTSKEDPDPQGKKTGRDFGLFCVRHSKDILTGKPVITVASGVIAATEVCTRIFFGVAARDKEETGCDKNFITGFVQGNMVMPTNYDPDVPNLGVKFPP